MKRIVVLFLLMATLLSAFCITTSAGDDNATGGDGSTHPATEGSAWYNSYQYLYKVTIYVGGEQVAKLNAKERGMATTIGQDFEMEFKIMEVKGGDETRETYQIKLPRKVDGIVVNIPAYLAGLPEEAWMSEFVPIATESTADTEEVPGGDEFEMDELGDF